MDAEETRVELKDAQAQGEDVEPQSSTDAARAAADADASEADVIEPVLDQEEREKQPMTGGGERLPDAPCPGAEEEEEEEVERNGSVTRAIPPPTTLKILDEAEDVKFTGLSKEELLRVAGTPGWVRTRWTLLFVFWLGWLSMLVGAVLIILQAPRCREPPAISWWNEGPLYQIGNIRAFTDMHNLMGLEQKLNSLSQLKLKGLVVGPIHLAPPDDVTSLSFERISPETGDLTQFKSFIQAAHRKGIFVVLDLTPNYQGSSGPWFSRSSVKSVAEKLKYVLEFWLNEGVDGIQLSAVEDVATKVPSVWAEIKDIIKNGTAKSHNKVLIGVTKSSSPEDVSAILNSTGVDLLISSVLTYSKNNGISYAETFQVLNSSHSWMNLAWNLGGPVEGHLASLVNRAQVKLHLLLLMTLPGTPIFNYGDEIGLMDEGTKFPKMLWDSDEELNGTLQEKQVERLSYLSFFCSVSELRSRKSSLLYGDFVLHFNSSSSLVYERFWDQKDRYLAAFNWAEEEAVVLQLNDEELPRYAELVLSTDSLPADTSVDLINLELGPGQAALIKLPAPE